jgi:polyhydroxyalkanoate synthesis regulator phasin
MVFGPILDKMIDEGKTFQEITERFAQELLQAQKKVKEREKEKEERLAALLGDISNIMSCYFPELYVKITPEVYNKYMNITNLNNLIYTIVKDMYSESINEEEKENKKLTF